MRTVTGERKEKSVSNLNVMKLFWYYMTAIYSISTYETCATCMELNRRKVVSFAGSI